MEKEPIGHQVESEKFVGRVPDNVTTPSPSPHQISTLETICHSPAPKTINNNTHRAPETNWRHKNTQIPSKNKETSTFSRRNIGILFTVDRKQWVTARLVLHGIGHVEKAFLWLLFSLENGFSFPAPLPPFVPSPPFISLHPFADLPSFIIITSSVTLFSRPSSRKLILAIARYSQEETIKKSIQKKTKK